MLECEPVYARAEDEQALEDVSAEGGDQTHKLGAASLAELVWRLVTPDACENRQMFYGIQLEGQMLIQSQYMLDKIFKHMGIFKPFRMCGNDDFEQLFYRLLRVEAEVPVRDESDRTTWSSCDACNSSTIDRSNGCIIKDYAFPFDVVMNTDNGTFHVLVPCDAGHQHID